ncbi:MAG: AbrB/MazE/SpoVT family DNA-binding domain-containing protein [Gemmatimonadota bacterium]|jgi:antitoxin MazE
MFSRVRKWGNSLAVRIPRAFARDAGLEEGTEIEMSEEDGGIRIRPARVPEYRLEDLLSGITADNLHGEADSGPSVGGEAW